MTRRRLLLIAGLCMAVALAVGLVARPGRRPDVEALTASFASPDAAARRDAADALGFQFPEGTRAVPVLVEALRDEDPSVRTASARALRRFADEAIVEAARIVSEDLTEGQGENMDPTEIPRVGILDAYQALGFAVGPCDVARGLLRTWRPETRQRAAIAIVGASLDHSNLAACRIALTWGLDDPDRRVRLAAAASLGLLAEVPALGESASVEVLEAEDSLLPSIETRVATTHNHYVVAMGSLGRSPGGGRRAAMALRAATAFDSWYAPVALLRMAVGSADARFVLLRHLSEEPTLGEWGADALAATQAWDVLASLLESADEPTRLGAARVLAGSGHATPRALRLLAESLRRANIPDGSGSLMTVIDEVATAVALGRAGSVASGESAELERRWREFVAESERREGQRLWVNFGTDTEPDVFAWAICCIDPRRADMRARIVAALRRGASPNQKLDSARKLILEAVESHPESDISILAGPPATLEAGPIIGWTAENGFLWGRNLGDPELMVEAIGRRGPAGRVFAPTLAALLDQEAARIEGEARALGWAVRATPEDRLRFLGQTGSDTALPGRLASLVHPEFALLIVHAIETVGVGSPAAFAALDRADALGSEVLHVAIARARRVLAAR